jgi:tol-pal system protein YbgF
MQKLLCVAWVVASTSLVYAETRPLPPIINNSSYANGASYAGRAPSNQPVLQMLGRIDNLQTEVQQLRGLVEQQNHEINNLKKRQQNIYADLNARLQHLETGKAIGSRSHPENLAVPVAQRRPVTAPVKPKQKPKTKASEKAAFDKAFASVRQSKYQLSIKRFSQFLNDYPAGEYSDNATFWLASVYKVVGDLANAKQNFQAVFTQFPKSEKAALSMLKLADIYLAENKKSKAKQMYSQITAQYAGSTSAHMAEKKLQKMGI